MEQRQGCLKLELFLLLSGKANSYLFIIKKLINKKFKITELSSYPSKLIKMKMNVFFIILWTLKLIIIVLFYTSSNQHLKIFIKREPIQETTKSTKFFSVR